MIQKVCGGKKTPVRQIDRSSVVTVIQNRGKGTEHVVLKTLPSVRFLPGVYHTGVLYGKKFCSLGD